MAEGRTLTSEQAKGIKELVNLLIEEEGIEGVVIADETGLPICSAGKIKEESELALSNTILGIYVESLKAYQELGSPYIDSIIVEGRDIKTYVSAEEKGRAYLAIFCNPETNMAVIRIIAKNTLKKIHDILEKTSERAEEFFDKTEKLAWLTPEERKKWKEIAGFINELTKKKQ
ncbi:MAG: roadblock/LC7 domain-containing protein [Candidatus Asgardarchaeia archaeon]